MSRPSAEEPPSSRGGRGVWAAVAVGCGPRSAGGIVGGAKVGTGSGTRVTRGPDSMAVTATTATSPVTSSAGPTRRSAGPICMDPFG